MSQTTELNSKSEINLGLYGQLNCNKIDNKIQWKKISISRNGTGMIGHAHAEA